jgi:hypothetical protein
MQKLGNASEAKAKKKAAFGRSLRGQSGGMIRRETFRVGNRSEQTEEQDITRYKGGESWRLVSPHWFSTNQRCKNWEMPAKPKPRKKQPLEGLCEVKVAGFLALASLAFPNFCIFG